MMQKKLIIFDDLCVLCSGSVRFIMKRDRNDSFIFAGLHEDGVRDFLAKNFRTETAGIDSVVLISGDDIALKSEAALEIAALLSPPWTALRFLKIIPKGLRDPVYDFVAKNRSRWFGRYRECWLPGPEDRERFGLEKYLTEEHK